MTGELTTAINGRYNGLVAQISCYIQREISVCCDQGAGESSPGEQHSQNKASQHTLVAIQSLPHSLELDLVPEVLEFGNSAFT